MKKIIPKETFSVTGLPEFVAGNEQFVEDELADTLIARDLVVLAGEETPKEEVLPKEEKPKKSETINA